MAAEGPDLAPPRRRTRLSLAEARRITLAAQGFTDGRPAGTADLRHLKRVLERIGLLQIDSVNVLARAHYLPLFARLGAYAMPLLDREAWGRRPSMFEYWGHEASLMPHALQPLMRWRMARAERGEGIYSGLARFAVERKDYVRAVLAEIETRGAIGAGELEDNTRGEGGWWGWSDGKRALEFLFWAGLVTTATRRGFERLYDLPERVLPKAVLAAPTPEEAEAQRRLMMIAARAMGVATERCLRDYFRIDAGDAKLRLAELIEAGELLPVTVEGWQRPAYLHPAARIPRRIEARALLAPFDPLVWERERTENLFGFRYRIEIYVPAEKRVHGYYVLPFLLGDRLVARVDLKADRAAGVLRVAAAHAEEGVDRGHVARELAEELRLMAEWLGLSDVVVFDRGDFSHELATVLGHTPRPANGQEPALEPAGEAGLP